MRTRLIIDCSTGETTELPLTPEEELEHPEMPDDPNHTPIGDFTE